MRPEPADLAACLRVLAALAGDPGDPALAEVRAAVDVAYRAGKKQRKTARHADRRARDLALLATATRYRDENPSPALLPAASTGETTRDTAEATGETREATGETGEAVAPVERAERRLHGGRRCYVCKQRYQVVDVDYHLLCPACAAENGARRHARADLTGRRAIVTGGRIKIGFQTAVKLLRDGAEVLVTTRFPADAARRFAAVPDAERWLNRLWIHGADFLDLPGVLGLVQAVGERWGSLDILINNAAQTVRRPPEYHREVRAAESRALAGPAGAIRRTGGGEEPGSGARTQVVPLNDLFPLGLRDETGEQLDLRDVNSWVLGVGDVSPAEWLETHVINAFVPFLLTGRLKPLMVASAFPDRYVVQVSAMEGVFHRLYKTPRHPHTNMAKAGLNMLTRTVAAEYAADGIHMCSVDTGWITDERPHPGKTAQRAAGFRPPLDAIDGAARVYDPIVRGVRGAPVHGVFLKDYREAPW